MAGGLLEALKRKKQSMPQGGGDIDSRIQQLGAENKQARDVITAQGRPAPTAVAATDRNRFTALHIELIRNTPVDILSGPLPAGRGGLPDEYSKPGWFRYFWSEAKPEKARFLANPEAVIAFCNTMFDLPNEWNQENAALTASIILRAEGKDYLWYGGAPTAPVLRRKTTWEGISNAVLRTLLDWCLDVGFTRYRCGASGTNRVDDPSARFADHKLFAGQDYACQFGWRGDTRSMQDLSATGFNNKAESDGYADGIGMRADWHPFSDRALRQDYWFRKAKSDNCLHTMISVALNFPTACTFPLLEQKLMSIPSMPTSKEEVMQLPAIQRQWFKKLLVRGASGLETIYRPADLIQLYLVVVKGQCFNTQGVQKDQFPEIAVKRVPQDNFMGVIRLARVFHGLTDDAGFSAFHNVSGEGAYPSHKQAEVILGERSDNSAMLRDRAWELYRESVNKFPFVAKWSPNGGGYMPTERPMQVVAIYDLDDKPFCPGAIYQ